MADVVEVVLQLDASVFIISTIFVAYLCPSGQARPHDVACAIKRNLLLQAFDVVHAFRARPTMLISPRSTLINCGSSSRRVLRIKRPMRVTRGSFAPAKTGPVTFSASGIMVRNLMILNSRPFSPTRSTRIKIGPGRSR